MNLLHNEAHSRVLLGREVIKADILSLELGIDVHLELAKDGIVLRQHPQASETYEMKQCACFNVSARLAQSPEARPILA